MKWPTVLITVTTLVSGSLAALDKTPWFTPVYELQLKADYGYQGYTGFDASPSPGEGESHVGVAGAGVTLSCDWAAELEVAMASTTENGMSFAHGAIAARRRWMDDAIGDCCSLVTGVVLAVPGATARQDRDLTYHGGLQGELFVSAGQECCCLDEWTSRYWMMALIGVGDGGAWSELQGHYQWHMACRHIVGTFVEAAAGFGGQSLTFPGSNDGYGDIKYRTLVLGAQYGYEIPCSSTIYVRYGYRVLSINHHENTQELRVSMVYPFSL